MNAKIEIKLAKTKTGEVLEISAEAAMELIHAITDVPTLFSLASGYKSGNNKLIETQYEVLQLFRRKDSRVGIINLHTEKEYIVSGYETCHRIYLKTKEALKQVFEICGDDQNIVIGYVSKKYIAQVVKDEAELAKFTKWLTKEITKAEWRESQSILDYSAVNIDIEMVKNDIEDNQDSAYSISYRGAKIDFYQALLT